MTLNQVGVAIHTRSSTEMLEAIRAAENAKVPTVWLTTGSGPDGLTVFAAAAAVTQRIRMGTAIVPTFPRHPLVVAQQTLDIALLAPRRFVLGLGPSHKSVMEGRYGIPHQRPLAHLREFVTVVRELLTGQQVDFKGDHFDVHAKLNDGVQVPIIISALRAGSFELAGEIADGAVTWLCPAPYLRDVTLPALERGASRQKRSRPSLIGHVFLAITTDEKELQQGVNEFLPHYPRLTNYQEMFAAAGYSEARTGTWSKAMVDAVVIHGDETQCAEKVRRFIQSSGVDELILSIMPTGSDRQRALMRALAWTGELAGTVT